MICAGTVWLIDDDNRTAAVSLAANAQLDDTVVAHWTTRPTVGATVRVIFHDDGGEASIL